MKKVFIIHGLNSSPNGGWRPWLMRKLAERDIYACALSMPTPAKPNCKEWVDEIDRVLKNNNKDKLTLVGHSLGASAILRFLEKYNGRRKIDKVILVSGPVQKVTKDRVNKRIHDFLDKPFEYDIIIKKVKKFIIIHGDNDHVVPLDHAKILSKELRAKLIVIKNGEHLNGSSGHHTLPACLNAIL